MKKLEESLQKVLDATIEHMHVIEKEGFENRKSCVNAFISLQTLLENIRDKGFDEKLLNENPFFNLYNYFMKPLLEIIYSPDNKGLENTYLNMLIDAVNEIIVANIIEGLNCGDVLPEDLEG